MTAKIKLTAEDLEDIDKNEPVNLLNKGAELYRAEKYEQAIEYYRLAAAMGQAQAIANLGYCYMYGRSIEPDINLGLAYFKMAANQNNIDALYKLGTMYKNGKGVEKNDDLARTYLKRAEEQFDDPECEETLDDYPSLCLILGEEYMPDGLFATNLKAAYYYLREAKLGFDEALFRGYFDDASSWRSEKVERLIENKMFDGVRKEIDEEFDDIII